MKIHEDTEYEQLNAEQPSAEESSAEELTGLELNLILGGYEPGYQENDPNANGWDLRSGSGTYGPYLPPLPVEPSGGMGGGLPPGAPTLAQPGNNAGAMAETLGDGVVYGARHGVAEAIDFGSGWLPPGFSYVADKVAEWVRPDEATFEEYAQNH